MLGLFCSKLQWEEEEDIFLRAHKKCFHLIQLQRTVRNSLDASILLSMMFAGLPEDEMFQNVSRIFGANEAVGIRFYVYWYKVILQ